MLGRRETYEELIEEFRWTIPGRFNIGTAVCDVWADRDASRPCLLHYRPDQAPERMTYGALRTRSDAFAQGLKSLGVERGDRVALLLPQGFDTITAHVAIYKIGAVAVPLALLFGPEALAYRLKASGARTVVTNAIGARKINDVSDPAPGTLTVVSVDGGRGTLDFEALIHQQPPQFTAVDTRPDDPAMMIFTSGTTGPPKGALHGHRVLLGHLPGFQFAYEFPPREGDLFWTPADWAWAGGLLNVLLPSLYFGVPVVSSAAQKFDPVTAFRIMETMGVRVAFLPPTALRMLKTVDRPAESFNLALRCIGSAGEALGRETYDWARRELGITINEFYGQTECNTVLGSCGALGISRAGSIGKPVPGHTVAVIDGQGRELPAGQPGQIAIRRPDPVMFLGYWNNPEATARKFVGDWMLTGDQGVRDGDGYVDFFGRDDDVITSAGYRIGPGEIEDCLIGHPAVALAAAVGKPDAVRTEIVKAYVVLKPTIGASHALAGELQDWVKERLSAHEYPREVEFVNDLPLTTTGKVVRRELRARALREARSAQS